MLPWRGKKVITVNELLAAFKEVNFFLPSLTLNYQAYDPANVNVKDCKINYNLVLLRGGWKITIQTTFVQLGRRKWMIIYIYGNNRKKAERYK